jgi:hypothetical protein
LRQDEQHAKALYLLQRPDRRHGCECHHPKAEMTGRADVSNRDNQITKYCGRTPLYRQSQILARQGVTLDRSTLSEWVGRACWRLAPVHELMLSTELSSSVVFADDTTACARPGPRTDEGRTVVVRRRRQSKPEWTRATGRGSGPIFVLSAHGQDCRI